MPVVPGYAGDDQGDERLRAEAERVGTPLLIKAAAGAAAAGCVVRAPGSSWGCYRRPGGRRGRRSAMTACCWSATSIGPATSSSRSSGTRRAAWSTCSSASARSSGGTRRSSRKALARPGWRAAGAHGRGGPGRAAAAAGYVNAGTVEFLLEEREGGDHRFYFLEVNTRLQVEHPVTETLTGIDLVQLQLRIADGEPLPFAQDAVCASGHVIEARIYAEDAAAGFLPSVGQLAQWIEPAGPGVRVDSGVERGSDVSPHYDPLLAKLIVRGATRAQALARMEQALMNFHALGVQTNVAYLLAIVRHPAFQAGETSTRFLDEHFAPWKPEGAVPNDVLLALAAEALTRSDTRPVAAAADPGADPHSPWRTGDAWRNTK